MDVTRRNLLQVLSAATAIATPVAAQGVAEVASVTDVDQAKSALIATVQAVRRVELAQSVEPAFKFVPRS